MKIAFLDRDGVLNEYPGDGDYVKTVKEMRLLPGALDAVKRLKDAGFKVFIISNQACVGRGIITQADLDEITEKLLKAARVKEIKFDGIYYCTHAPDAKCDCRKPGIANIKKVLGRLGTKIEFVTQGYFVGDTDKDIETGHKAGLKTILVQTGRDSGKDIKNWAYRPHQVVRDLNQAVDIILS